MSTPAFSAGELQRDHLPRRRRVNRLMEFLAMLAAASAVAVLVIVVLSVALEGLPALNLDFFTKTPVFFSGEETGIANAIVGTGLLVLFAALMAIPVGILIAIYVNEFAPPRVANLIALVLDVMNGIPAVVIGIFVFGLIVLSRGQSGLAGSFALAIIMLPLVSRATQEVLALVPNPLREGSLALGVSRWRTTLSIVLPQTIGGIVTGSTLAVARVSGETAPLLFTSSLAGNAISGDPTKPLASIPFTIYNYSEQADPLLHEQAWAAALVLIAFVLVASTIARVLAARSRRRLTGQR